MHLLLLLAPFALAIDPQAWQQVLTQHLDANGRVDYSAIKAEGRLDPWLAELAIAAEPPAGPGRTAFWINAYNALTVDLIADAWPLASIRDLDDGKVWDSRHFTVAGRTVSLNSIEHEILRPLGDPRIHAAINCASQGCPPLSAQAFSGPELEGQLAAAARRWVQGNGLKVDQTTRTVALNQIFDWYGDDFAAGATFDIPGVEGKAEWGIDFALQWLPAGATADWLRAGGYTVSWAPYGWGVNVSPR